MYHTGQLEECLKAAWSYENREEHESYGTTTFVGTVQRGNRLYDLYVDENRNYFYKTRIIAGRDVVSEYEAIFGHPEKKRNRRRET